MFSYCGNSPVCRFDALGNYFKYTNPFLGGFSNIGGNATGVSTGSAAGGSDGYSFSIFALLFPNNNSLSETEQVTATSNTQITYNYNGAKTRRYVNKRGWTDEMITEAISNGRKGTSVNAANNSPCTVYGYPGTSNQYVVIDDTSGNIVQVSDFNDSNWIVDGRIQWAP